jgi:hypothetical protein
MSIAMLLSHLFRPVALRQLRKLKLSSLGWTKRSYENKNELLQLNQQLRKTAVSGSYI